MLISEDQQCIVIDKWQPSGIQMKYKREDNALFFSYPRECEGKVQILAINGKFQKWSELQ